MQIRDLVFVATVAIGAGWTISAAVLEVMSADAAHSPLWLPLARLFLFFACGSFVIALVRELWRVRKFLARSPWLGGAALVAAGASFVTLGLGNLHTAWILVIVGLCGLLVAEGPRLRNPS
jgi:peptidoglycan/LPS O-acetylase OafA/YrhL